MNDCDVLIAGIGNIFLRDDAFGCEVALELSRLPWPEEVQVIDFGIRGLDLAYRLIEKNDLTILIDAVPLKRAPGTLVVLELDSHVEESWTGFDPHSMHPLNVLRLVRQLGGSSGRILLVGCEPADVSEPEDGEMGLSPVVREAVPAAVKTVQDLVAEFLRGNTSGWAATVEQAQGES